MSGAVIILQYLDNEQNRAHWHCRKGYGRRHRYIRAPAPYQSI